MSINQQNNDEMSSTLEEIVNIVLTYRQSKDNSVLVSVVTSKLSNYQKIKKLLLNGKKFSLMNFIAEYGNDKGLRWHDLNGCHTISYDALQNIKKAQDPTAKAKEPTAKAKEPTAKAKEPTAKAKEPTAKAMEPTAKPQKPTTKAKEQQNIATTPEEQANGKNEKVKQSIRLESTASDDDMTLMTLVRESVGYDDVVRLGHDNGEVNYYIGTGTDINKIFFAPTNEKNVILSSAALIDFPSLCDYDTCDIGLMGIQAPSHKQSGHKEFYLNVSDPFCMICIGNQGAGKSHTMLCALENCMINTSSVPSIKPLIKLHHKMCGLVLHFDQSVSNCCEAIGLNLIDHKLDKLVSPVGNLVVLVSPTYFTQRKKFYHGFGIRVLPLLFTWKTLNAQQLRKIMRLNQSDSQLYVSVMLDLLRQYQRNDQIPIFEDFVAEISSLCSKSSSQSGPLEQRLRFLNNIVKESEINKSLAEHQVDLSKLMASDTLVVCDLTDPLLSADEANGIFQVMLEQFRNKVLSDGCGKVVVFDEAHKYLSHTKAGSGKEELSASIVDTVRLMRHEGIRVLVSTQSPLALPSELLELVTITVLHHFQSSDWYDHLSSKIPLPQNGFDMIKKLRVGEALIVSTKIKVHHTSDVDTSTAVSEKVSDELITSIKARIRRRLTKDYGSSRIHKKLG